jgi:DNA topoisomerase-1
MVVNDFLVTHFPNVTDYSFTAGVEKELDDIADGNFPWNNMINDFYGKFHPRVESTENIERSQVGSTREIGVDPKSGKNIYAKLGKFGPYVQLGENEDEEKPKYASLRTGQFIENISLEDALELFKLPRDIGPYEDEIMIAAIGKFGPYIRHKGKFYSIGKELDPMSITPDEAIEIIEIKRKADAEKFIKVFDENPDVQVLKGRYGPYIKVGKKNVKIPKDKEPESLTLEECLDLAEKAPEKGRRGAKKK